MVLSVLTSELFSVGHSQCSEIVLVVTDTFWKEGFGRSWSIADQCQKYIFPFVCTSLYFVCA